MRLSQLPRFVLILSSIIAFTSCHNVQDIPFPEELSENPQPQTIPLKLTDPKPLHWDTIGHSEIRPAVFPLDFSKMKGMPYDPEGFKPLSAAPTTTTFNFSALPSKPFTPEKDKEIPLKVTTRPLAIPVTSADKFQAPTRLTTTTMDIRTWQQLGKMNIPVYTIAKSPLGMLWIGGTKLVCFDGTRFATYLQNVSVRSIWFDHNGNLWFISTLNNGTTLYKIDIQHNLITSALLPFSVGSVTSKVFCDSNGIFWIPSTSSSPLIKIYPEKMTYSLPNDKSGLYSSRYYQGTLDKNGRIWFGTQNGIEIIDQRAKTITRLGKENGIVSDTVSAIIPGQDGTIWAATSNTGKYNLENIDPRNGKITHYSLTFPSQTFIVRLKPDNSGNLWISTQFGFAILNPKENIIRYVRPQSLSYPFIDEMEEFSGKMLLSSLTIDGISTTLLEVRQNGKTVYPFGNTLIISATEDSKGNLWVGTNDNLLVVDSSRTTYWKIGTENGLANQSLQNVDEQAGKIVITSNGGYNIYDPQKNKWSRITRKEGLIADTIYSIITDTKGNEWMSGYTAGLIKYEKKSGLVLRLRKVNGLNGNGVNQASEFGNKIWVIYDDAGPGIIDPEKNTIQTIKSPAEINGIANKAMTTDDAGNIWLTGMPDWGLYRIDPVKKTLIHFTTREGLGDNSTYSLLEYNGEMLVNTLNKINILTPPDISPDKRWHIGTLAHSAELKKIANTWISDAITKRGNYLWGDNGMVIIHGIKADTSKSTDQITGLRIMDRDLNLFGSDSTSFKDLGNSKTKISPASMGYIQKGNLHWDSLAGPFSLPVNLSLPYDQNVIQFNFTEVGSGRSDSLEFAYVLEGFDKKWTTTHFLSTRTYLNLSPGDYIFKVASRSKSGFWNEPASFSFTIRPPWYLTWWAYLIYAITALSLLRLYIIFRSRKLMRQNKILEEKVNQRTEELQKSYDNVEKLEEIGKKITSSLSVEKIIGTVYNNVNALMDASVFGIGIYNDEFKRLDFPSTYENGKVLPPYLNDISDANRMSAVCFNEGKEIVMGNLGEQHKKFVQNIPTPIAGDQAVSLIYLPLMAKEKKLGVITVQSFKPNAYTEYHVNMLRNIAIYTAIALENARSYDALKSTQAQLIQSEKMASLGELTAGIAHEIQNPLNFVNNFSDLNKELVGELKEENAKPEVERDKGLIDEILTDISMNSEKINFHGKRADAIVKGMLQHSRGTSGKKEPTDINALCDEYLRLSFHGLRAKDKSFNAKFETHFDENAGKINVVPQDIGRVVLNLINNAFYAVTERKKSLQGLNGDTGYVPTVIVSTRKVDIKSNDSRIEISVKDNGNGIPHEILKKIFQPFFTTKPAGKGTGLGLSLSYDIVKTHNGELKVESKEKEGTEFFIELPY